MRIALPSMAIVSDEAQGLTVPLYYNVPVVEKYIEEVSGSYLNVQGTYASFDYVTTAMPKELLLSSLLMAAAEARTSFFEQAFSEIDAKMPRNARGIILALVDGTFPSEETLQSDLTPEQEQRIIDIGIMWQLEEVAQTNRDLLHELQSLTITEEMTLEEAQNVVRKARDMRPWLPWAPHSPP